MIKSPFEILEAYAKDIRVEFFKKDDHIETDDELLEAGKYAALASLWQVHGGDTIIVTKPTSREEKADGIITEIPGLSLSIRVADCQNFAVYDPEHKVLGMMHAGWKGLLANVIPNFFEKLHKKFHSKASDVIVIAGPSLCLRCSEFSDPVSELPGIDSEFIHGRLVDLRGIAERQLKNAGVRPENFERHPHCTKCMNDLYFSYRGSDKELVKAGVSNSLVCTLR